MDLDEETLEALGFSHVLDAGSPVWASWVAKRERRAAHKAMLNQNYMATARGRSRHAAANKRYRHTKRGKEMRARENRKQYLKRKAQREDRSNR